MVASKHTSFFKPLFPAMNSTPENSTSSQVPPRQGLAIASLVLGILGLFGSLIVVGAFLGLVGAVLGLVHVAGKRGRNAMAWWGVGLSILGVLASVVLGAFYFKLYTSVKETVSSMQSGSAPLASGPVVQVSPLKDADKMLTAVALWSTNVPGATALCGGDWEGSGQKEILVAAGTKLHVLGLDGAAKSVVPLPETFSVIECGHGAHNEARLLGYSSWGRKVVVLDNRGKELWNFSSLMGVDGAHWGDLDGDGVDEMIVGMNGLGGLEALSADGKKLWHEGLANVWSQAVISADKTRPAQVFATEASGNVRVFDGQGKSLHVLHPNGAYCTLLAAGLAQHSGQVQVLASGQGSAGEQAVAFDAGGQVAWSAPVKAGAGGWVQQHFACGDLAGDGSLDWAFLQPSGELALVTTEGLRIAALPGSSGIKEFVVVPDSSGRGVLVTLSGSAVQAYTFKP
jgi:hypothetical protein